MEEKWRLKVVRVNFGLGGTPENIIEDEVSKVLERIEGDVKDVIYTNPTDIQKAVIFIVFKGAYTEAAPTKNEATPIDKGGIKADIESKED